MSRIISGIQPSGKLHIGNYFWDDEACNRDAKENEAFLIYCRLSCINPSSDPKLLKSLIKDAVLDFLACGIDPETTCLYRQSDVPQVHELSWFLSCFNSPPGLLERCHS